MLKQLTEFVVKDGKNEIVTLIPNSGVQFMDFGFKAEDIKKYTQSVVPVRHLRSPGSVMVAAVEVDPKTEFATLRVSPERQAEAFDYQQAFSVKADRALAIFENQWLPFPCFRGNLETDFSNGPTTWSRMRFVKLAEPDAKGNTHRLVLAFDTLLEPRLDKEGDYLAPEEPGDSETQATFSFCADPAHLVETFLQLDWIGGWLKDAYIAGVEATSANRRPPEAESLDRGDFYAAYLSLINLLKGEVVIPDVKLVDIYTHGSYTAPVGVNLVLDIGNSRMCGVLVEDGDSEAFADLNKIYRLELRDLTRVEHVYSDPFESHIEFAAPYFGPLEHTSKANRTTREAFWWPSPVRVGPEAARLAAQTNGTEGTSGLSSPKRYLWDNASRPQPWMNNTSGLPNNAVRDAIRSPVVRYFDEEGTKLSRYVNGRNKDGKMAMPGLRRLYSRASLYTFMLAELLLHAVSQINSVAVRRNQANSAIPRVLRQVIFTLPTATPIAEQRAMALRIEDAVELLWDLMGWNKPRSDGTANPAKPRIRIDWDEATCTHMVYLYNELRHTFQGSPREFFQLTSRQDKPQDAQASLRVASIDIGGGTTDLMIMDHRVKQGTDEVLEPQQLFREGFRLAGDDIIKQLIEDFMLPKLQLWLAGEGQHDGSSAQAQRAVSRTFGGNQENMGQRERTMRAQVVSRLLAPATVGLMSAYEKDQIKTGDLVSLKSLLPQDIQIPRPAIAWAEEMLGLAPDRLLEMCLTIDIAQIETTILGLLKPMFDDLADLVRVYDCDVLLLSGRPSQFPIVRRMILSAVPLPVNRIITMGTYRVGSWYPFRSEEMLIRDPKTTAVVGAMLCHLLGSSRVNNLNLRTEALQMQTTARFLGRMNDHGRIEDDKVLIENYRGQTEAVDSSFVMHMESACFLGFRQLPLARWRGSPLYHIRFTTPEKIRSEHLPLAVTFERKKETDADGDTDPMAYEDFKVSDVQAFNGDDLGRKAVTIRLQTLVIENQGEAGYWLDTGVLHVKHQ